MRHVARFEKIAPEDVQATLLELSAASIVNAVVRDCPDTQAVYACGGGSRNGRFMKRLSDLLGDIPLATTGELGIDPQLVEAAAFAWLAARRMDSAPVALRSITGASRDAVLGALYEP